MHSLTVAKKVSAYIDLPGISQVRKGYNYEVRKQILTCVCMESASATAYAPELWQKVVPEKCVHKEGEGTAGGDPGKSKYRRYSLSWEYLRRQ